MNLILGLNYCHMTWKHFSTRSPLLIYDLPFTENISALMNLHPFKATGDKYMEW